MKKTQLIAALLSAAMLQSSIASAAEAFSEIESISLSQLIFADHGGGRHGGADFGGGFNRGGNGGFQPPQRQEPRQEPRWSPPPQRQEPPRQEPRWNPPPQRQEPPRQEPRWNPPPQRQEPPRQEPRWNPPPQRQQPPRQEPPRQEPPRREPPTRIPPPTQQPPRQEPPRREPPRREPPTRIPPPTQQPPRREPPRREPPTRIPPPSGQPQRPPRQNPPGHERPPVQRPPVVVRPGPQPGRPGRVELPRREPIRDHDRIMDPGRNGTRIDHPRTFPDGRPITARPVTRGPHGDHITIINNTTVINNVRNYNRWETERNRYYWHDWDGHRFCHYYDHYGFHWYGWYIGDVYFWTRYWNDMYWWYDPYYGRWVYMRDGRWWYQDPANVEIVYLYTPETNTYYQYDDAPGGGVVMTPDPTTPVTTPPSDPSEPDTTTPAQQPQKIFMSPDGRRSVQVFGDTNDAFLYDTAETPSFNPVFLASNVTEARFSQSAADQPLTVLLLTEDKADDGTVTKSFKMYDENGNDLSAAPQQEDPVAAPVDAPSGDDTGAQNPPAPSSTLNMLKSKLGSFGWN